jgi:hypothetical protein
LTTESAFIPAPHDGISQSAPQIRLAAQASDLQDCLVDIPNGFRKRPPLSWLGQVVATGALATARIHKLKDPDDASIKFLVLNREGAATVPRLFDSAMAAISLTTTGAAQTYLNTAATPLKTTLRTTQAIDYTFLTSRTLPITIDPSLNATRPHEALVFVKSGAYGKKYQLLVQKSGGTLRSAYVTTPSGATASDSFFVATDHIAGALAGADAYTAANGAANSSIQTDLATDGFTVTIKGAVIYLSHTTDFTVNVQDDQGGVAIKAIKDTVNDFSDLPNDGVTDGFTVSVIPTRGDNNGAYYVKYNVNPSRGSKPWSETYAPGSQKGFLLTTMPIGVYKDSGGVWNCAALPWMQRSVGDQTLAIDPLFVGDTIQDIGYNFGRLIILSSEECFMAAADNPFRIYPATLTTQIDSDPISLVAPSGNAKFRSITSFSSDAFEGAYLTGLLQQCILRSPGGGPVTPNAAKLGKLSGYTLKDTFTNMRPVPNNNKVYLPIPLGSLYSGIREMKLDRISGESLGNDMTAAVPKLLPAGLDVSATSEATYTSMYGVAGGTKIYTHVFRYSDNERVQNGLFTWNLPSGWTLCDIINEGTLFYFFLVNAARMCCFTLETNPEEVDQNFPGATILTKLDMRQTQDQITGAVYTAASDTTLIGSNVPLPAGQGYVAASAPGAAYPEGYLAEVVSQPSATSIMVKGDWSFMPFYLGISYVGLWTLSPINKYSQDSRIIHGRLTLARLTFDLKASSAIAVEVTNAGRPVRRKELAVQPSLGSPTLFTGALVVPVKGDTRQVTITVRDEGHIGATISGFEWEGDFESKTHRIT